MRRDLFYVFESPVSAVYEAYERSIREILRKNPEGSPYHTLSFGLNFSMKFNMNGGSCHVHLMPYGSGTAVGVRYSIAQAVGARYEAHCKVMTQGAEKFLGIASKPARLTMEAFLKPENQITEGSVPTPASAPAAETISAPAPTGNPYKFCPQCGTKLDSSARFCTACGVKQ